MRTNRKLLWIVLPLALVATLTACGQRSSGAPFGVAAGSPNAPAAQPAPAPAGSATRIDANAVNRAMLEVEPDATLGAVVIDRETNEQLLSFNADEQFRSASLVKLMIAIDVLSGAQGPDDRDRITRMLSASDDNIASQFWVDYGGSEIVTRTSGQLGLTGTAPPENPGQWGDVSLTPNDVARIYQYVMTQLPEADRELIVQALEHAGRRAADGWDQHFGIPDGIGSPWGVKQGWGNNDEAKVVHSTGLVGENRRYVVVLLTRHPLDTSWDQATRSITAAAASFKDMV